MRILNWNRSHEIYIPEIDAEHRALFQMVNRMHDAVLAGGPEAEHMAREVAAHVVAHFEHEEALMRATFYASFDWHHRQHEAIVAKITRILRRMRRGDPKAGLAFLSTLAEWLRTHTAVSDRMMGAHLRNHRLAAAVA
jgi:hemerythrin